MEEGKKRNRGDISRKQTKEQEPLGLQRAHPPITVAPGFSIPCCGGEGGGDCFSKKSNLQPVNRV